MLGGVLGVEEDIGPTQENTSGEPVGRSKANGIINNFGVQFVFPKQYLNGDNTVEDAHDDHHHNNGR